VLQQLLYPAESNQTASLPAFGFLEIGAAWAGGRRQPGGGDQTYQLLEPKMLMPALPALVSNASFFNTRRIQELLEQVDAGSQVVATEPLDIVEDVRLIHQQTPIR